MPHALAFVLAFAAPLAIVAPASRAPSTPARTVRADAVRADAARADSVRADDDMRLIVLRNARDVRRCYEREGLRRNAALRGTLEVELTILPTGVVEHVDVVTVGLAGSGTDELRACVVTAVRNWRFERGPYPVETVVFPFHLAPEQRELSSYASARD